MNHLPDRWKTSPAGAPRETAAGLGEAAAADLDEFRTLFLERRAIETSPPEDPLRLELIRRAMSRLAPVVQRHLETLGGAMVAFDDPSTDLRARRQPLPLTYIAAFGSQEDYEGHADALTGALETAAGRYRAGEGGEERLARHRRRRRSSRRSHVTRRVVIWGIGALGALVFYVGGLRAFGDWTR